MIRRSDTIILRSKDEEKYLSIAKDIAKWYGIPTPGRPRVVLNNKHRTVRKK
jgi:hypothetical protein